MIGPSDTSRSAGSGSYSSGSTTGTQEPKTAEAKQRASESTQQAKESARRAGEEFKQEASRATAELKDAAGRAAGEAKSRVSEVVQQRKSVVADQVATFSAAARDAAGRLEDDGSPGAEYLQTAADSLDRAADYLKNSDLNELMNGAERFTRRHPEVVLGGLFLVGVGIARFLKASNEDRYYGRRRDFDAEMWPNNREMKPVARYGSDHLYSTNYPPTPESSTGPDWISVGGDVTPRSATEPTYSGESNFSNDPTEVDINSPFQRSPR